MIKIVTDNAHKNKIWVGICGELASDEVLTKAFLSLGIDELSMQSSFILGIRKTVMETNVAEVKDDILREIQ
jgi:phosphotransferase system enzyme I (PtsI)